MTFDVSLAPVLVALLGSVRVFAMMAVGPLFGHPAVSMRTRILASVLVAWAASPVAVDSLGPSSWQAAPLALAAGVEVLIGLAVGISASFLFAAMLQLGEFLAIQGGIGAAQAIDPTTGTASPAIGMALQFFALLVFLVIDGHHALLQGIAESFRVFPVGGGLPPVETFLSLTELAGTMWQVTFTLAAPVSVAIFVQNVVTGVLGRAMPQLNILIVNLPLHVAVVLLVLGLGANDVIHAIKDRVEVWPDTVFSTLLGGAHGG